jgi:hypothetical protein
MTTLPLTSSYSTSASICLTWFSSAWQLFKKAPFSLFGLLILLFVVSGLFQMLPAPTGIFVSKWIAPMLMAVMWPLLDQLSRNEKLSIRGLKDYSGWTKLPVYGVILLLPFFIQLGVAIIMLGNTTATDLLIFGQLGDVQPIHVALIFASASPLALLLMFVPAFLLLKRNSIISSLTNGITMVIRAWQPMLVLLIINTSVLFSAPYTAALSVIMFGPFLLCVNYQAFQYLLTNDKDSA